MPPPNNILDANVEIEHTSQLRRPLKVKQIGVHFLPGNADDERIISSLRRLKTPTFITWDCKDYLGRPVLPGKYTYRIEGNMLFRNIVLYTGILILGDTQDSSVATHEIFTSTRTDEAENFILDVSAEFQPAE